MSDQNRDSSYRRVPQGPRAATGRGKYDRDTKPREYGNTNRRPRRDDQSYRQGDRYPPDSRNRNQYRQRDRAPERSERSLDRGLGRARERGERNNFSDDFYDSAKVETISKPSRNNPPSFDKRERPSSDQHVGYSAYTSPDYLKGVVPIDKRDRSSFTKWDIRPKNFENISAEKAKLLGIFPLPGPNRKQIDPKKIEEIVRNESHKEILNENSYIDPKDSANARKLIVRNVVSLELIDRIVAHFNDFLSSLKVFEGTETKVKQYAFEQRNLVLEFTNYQAATISLALNNYILHDLNGFMMALERPVEYVVPLVNFKNEILSDDKVFLADNHDKLTIINVPTNINEEALAELVTNTISGELLYCKILLDKEDNSKGIAFLQIKDSKLTEAAVVAINQIKIANQQLKCVKSCIGSRNNNVVNYRNLLKGVECKDIEARDVSKVLQLFNLFDIYAFWKADTPFDTALIEKELTTLEQDLKRKIGQFAKVLEIKVPRPRNVKPSDSFHTIGKLNGFGKAFIKFASFKDSEICLLKLNGIKYFDRQILMNYFSEHDFDLNIF